MATRRLVLLAEDDPSLLKLVPRVLAGADYEVVSASTSAEALEALALRRADLAAAVLDAAILPGGAGPLVDAIAAGGEGTGVVLVSGDALPDDLAERCRRHGGVFLRKPFAPRALLDAVEQARRDAPGGGE